MEYKIGDKVRFVTTEPQYDASHSENELTVVEVFDDGDLEVSYSEHGYTQTVHPDDVEHAHAS